MITPLPYLADPRDAARQSARMLLDVGAVLFNAREPFTFTSGRQAPVYVDCRRLISYPRVRSALMDLGAARLLSVGGFESIDVVAGGETAGIPFAAWIAERLALPMVYVRKAPKGFGRMAQIEGVVAEGAAVALVEDLATDGGSKAVFVKALRDAGATVSDIFVVFHYGIFPQSSALMADLGVRLHALTTWHDVVATARDDGLLDPETLASVERYLADPESWTPG